MPTPFAFLDPGELTFGDVSLRLLRTLPPNPDRGWAASYVFDVLRAQTGDVAGRLSLRLGEHPDLYFAGHIGYEVYPDFRGRRYALQAVRAVLPLARRHGMARVLITCSPENLPSKRTCELSGARYLETVDVPPTHELYLRGETRKRVYELAL